MRSVLWGVASLLVFSAAACSSDGNDKPTDETVKAAWVYVGPIGDHGWSYEHNQGRLNVIANVADVETMYVENVSEDNAEPAIQGLVDKGADIVFTTSFGYMDATTSAAGKNPKAYFEHCSGFKTATNLSNYFGRMYQVLYLAGMVAGRATTSNKIGVPAAWPISEVIRHINAFTLGARSVNPKVEVHVKWLNSWYDPPSEEKLTNELLDLGVDVVLQTTDSTAVVLAAKARGAKAVGYQSDMLSFAPDTVLTSGVWQWGAYYAERVKAVKEAKWTSQSHMGSIGDGIVKLGGYGSMVQAPVRAEVAEKRGLIEGAKWDVFHGEVLKQDGTSWIGKGDSMTDDEMLSMREFVQGVVGEIPKTCGICGP
ncbi:MAG: BMP family ABC transporter substrate-binding protein [Deltaproteobacteria bacterium]|nr:BMP family ABC transporter substrate-binding protein [Deltaproteobacteria bacterium]